jgi:hypothetical protein
VVVAHLAPGAVRAWGGDAGSPVGDRAFECLQLLAFGLHHGRDGAVLIAGAAIMRGPGST